MILILAWDVCFTQAQVWALAWEAGLVQEALALEVGFVLDLELITVSGLQFASRKCKQIESY